MNTLFKALLLTSVISLSTSAIARDIILIENTDNPEHSKLVLKILTEKFNIPESFIRIKQTANCTNTTDAIMHLCVETDAEMRILKLETYAVENMLRTFIEMGK